jgi:FkbM family methyltransferase
MLQMANDRGYFERVARYSVNGVPFHVPLYRKENRWTESDVHQYEQEFVNAYSTAISTLQDATLVDCGADIGTFSALVASRCRNLKRVMAFEPNPVAYDILALNCRELPMEAQSFNKAVSNFTGQGRLERPNYDTWDSARYLVPGEGDIQAVTIDSFGITGDLALKVDVEGGEMDVFRGAAETIRKARRCIIGFEAQPWVSRRLGQDPVELARHLAGLREFRFVVTETGQPVGLDAPILKPDQTEIWNIIATSVS